MVGVFGSVWLAFRIVLCSVGLDYGARVGAAGGWPYSVCCQSFWYV